MPRLLRRPRSWRGLLLAGVAAFVAAGVLVLAVGALVLPRVLRQALEERLQARLTVPVRIARVHLNLFTARARVSDVEVGGLGGGPPILALAGLDFQVSYRALLGGQLVLRYLTFDRPWVFVERTGPDSVNVLQALRPAEGGAAAAGMTVEHATLQGGAVTFVDRTQVPAFERTFTDVALTAGTVSTLPEFRFTPTSFEARLGIGRGALTVTGSTMPFARPSGLELVARMEGIEPGLLRGYLPLRARIDLRGSRVDGEVHYRLAYRGDEVLENGLTARVETGPVRLLPLDDDTPLVSFASLVGRDIRADFRDKRIRLGDVVVREPQVRLVRGPTGLNLADLVQTDAAPAPAAAPSGTRQAAPPAEAGRPVSVVVGRARLEGGLLEFSDRTMTPVVSATLRDVGVRLQEVSLGPATAPGRLDGEARVEGGRVRFDGTVEGGTLATRIGLRVTGVPLQPFRPYVEPALRGVTVPRGSLDASLQVVLALRDAAGPRVDVAGTVEARDLALALPSAPTPSLTSRRVAVELTRLRVAPVFEADIARARVVGATLRVTRGRDGSLDVQRLWATAATSAGPAATPPPSPSARPFTIRRLELAESRVEFADAGVSPAFRETLHDLSADARSTAGHPDRMSLRVRSRVGEAASLEAEGWVAPFGGALRLQVKGAVRDFELPALNPYVVRYVGHRVERGRVSAEVAGSYDGGSYTADTRITVRHLRVGDEVDSELREGLGIPLKLAVSLLEDPSGDIDLRVPITGGADGTQFHLRHVILTVLRNTLVKTLAAPFRMFGSLLTQDGRIGEVRIDPVEFRPGSLEPNDEASARLARVIEFAKDRPSLGLRIRGLATPAEVEALKQERLREALKKTPPVPDTPMVAVYRAAGGPAAQSPPPEAAMAAFVLERTRITEDDLRALAEQRARVIQEALVRRGIELQRLSMARDDRTSLVDAGAGRVEFELVY